MGLGRGHLRVWSQRRTAQGEGCRWGPGMCGEGSRRGHQGMSVVLSPGQVWK